MTETRRSIPTLSVQVTEDDARLFREVQESGVFTSDTAILTTAFNLLRPHFERYLLFREAVSRGIADIDSGATTIVRTGAPFLTAPWILTDTAINDALDILSVVPIDQDRAPKLALEFLQTFAARFDKPAHRRERSYLPPGIVLLFVRATIAVVRKTEQHVQLLRFLDRSVDVPEPGCETDEL